MLRQIPIRVVPAQSGFGFESGYRGSSKLKQRERQRVDDHYVDRSGQVDQAAELRMRVPDTLEKCSNFTSQEG